MSRLCSPAAAPEFPACPAPAAQHTPHRAITPKALQQLPPRLLDSLLISKSHLAPTATTADLPHTAPCKQPLHACPPTWGRRKTWAAGAAAGCPHSPSGLRRKGHPGTASKGDGNNSAETRRTHCYPQTPSHKTCVPIECPNFPSPLMAASEHTI